MRGVVGTGIVWMVVLACLRGDFCVGAVFAFWRGWQHLQHAAGRAKAWYARSTMWWGGCETVSSGSGLVVGGVVFLGSKMGVSWIVEQEVISSREGIPHLA